MDKDQETFQTWNKMHLLYQEKFMDMKFYNESYDFFCDLLHQNQPKVLEIGCGPGNITKYILEKNNHFNILGIDYSPNMIELAKLNNPKANFMVLDAKKISKIQDKFDAIICGFLIPYLSQPELEIFMQNINNTLNENGILYISFVEGNYENSGYQVNSDGDKVYFHYYSWENLTTLFNKNNFEELKRFEVDYPNPKNDTSQTHQIIIARKKT